MAATFPMTGLPQPQIFDNGDSHVSKPWEEAPFKLNPKTRIKLAFRNAGVDNVLALFMQKSGITIVKDPNLTGRLTITSATDVGLKEAYQILSTTLSLRGFDLEKDGSLLVIRQKQSTGRGNGRIPGMPNPTDIANQTGDGNPFQFQRQGQNDPVLRWYPIKYASATALAKVLNDIFTPLPSTTVAFGGGPFGGGGPGRRFGAGGFQAPQGSQGPNVKASADDFSNSVVMNAPESVQTQVKELIGKLDTQTPTPLETRVYKLKYAAATDLTSEVQTILTANAPTGRGQSSNTNQGGGGGFFGRLFGGGANSNNTQVVADARSNSLVATSTPDNLDLIDKVVKELDKDVPYEAATIVVPLANARSDDVAALLTQAFGQRQGASNTSRSASQTQITRPTVNSTNSSSTGLGSSTPGRSLGAIRAGTTAAETRALSNASGQSNASEIPIALEDPNATEGNLLTMVGVTQGFGFLNQNQGRSGTGQTGSTATLARGANGQLTNVRDATGQVTIISDPNTNSVIVVTTPDYAQVLKDVILKLDRVPQQVMIQTMVVEASLDASDKLGVEWKFGTNASSKSSLAQNFGVQTSTTPNTGVIYSIGTQNMAAYINALQTDTKFHVLSTPRIFTSNNVQANINISQQIPYVTSTTLDATTNTTTQAFSYIDVGIVLTVTPHISSNGVVSMDVTQTANELQGYSTTAVGQPIINQREAQTTVAVKDGQTIILGGIIQNQVTSTTNKIPLLGDIPLLGKIFQSRSHEKSKTELLVFLTPRIVLNDEDAQKLKDEGVKALSPDVQKNFKELEPPAKQTPKQDDSKKPGS